MCQKGLVEAARRHNEAGSFKKAKAILLPLAEEGSGEAQEALGDAIIDNQGKGLSPREYQNNYSSALFWYYSAAFALEGEEAALGNAEHSAMICCEALQKYAQAKFAIDPGGILEAPPA